MVAKGDENLLLVAETVTGTDYSHLDPSQVTHSSCGTSNTAQAIYVGQQKNTNMP